MKKDLLDDKTNCLYRTLKSILILTFLISPNYVLADCPDWARGSRYSTGDLVEYNGTTYIADSYNQKERKWMWRPTLQTCIAGISESTENSAKSCGNSWIEGQWYNIDDEVEYGGINYVAVQGNPGYNPTIRTWFWEATNKVCGSSVNSITSNIIENSGG